MDHDRTADDYANQARNLAGFCVQYEREAKWLRHVYEGAARELCKRDGIDPDEVISDSGHLAWEMHVYQEACKHMGEPAT